jgi:lysophospholipase L1-like esterase
MSNVKRRIGRIMGVVRDAWSMIGITLALFLILECVFRAGFGIRDKVAGPIQPDRRVLAEGYAGASWPIQHYRELEQLEDRWKPYVYFRERPFQGETITVDSVGSRKTWQPPSPVSGDRRPRIKLLMLGGSTLWGFGARDNETIPSHVARGLDKRGYQVELRNFAELGYVSTQELIALLRELQAGYRPDVVVFYDGVNDTTSALLEGEAGITTNEVNRRREFNLLQSPARLSAALVSRLVKDSGSYRFAEAVGRRIAGEAFRPSRAPTTKSTPALAEDVVNRYEANVALAESLGRAFGFRALFFWHPVVFDKRKRVPFEEEEARKYAWSEEIFREVAQRIEASPQLNDNRAFRNLVALFSDEPGLVFIDHCHTTEAANATVAAVIADRVIESFEHRGKP